MEKEIDILKKTIKNTLENTISTIDPAFNLDDAIDTYIKVLDYEMTIPTIDELDGLRNSKIPILTRALVNRDYSEESSALIGVFNQRFESFIKKLYFTLEEFGEISNENRVDLSKPNAISPFLTSLNKSNPYYLDIDNNLTLKRKEAKIDKFQNPVLKLSNGQNQYYRLYSNSINFTKYLNPYDSDLLAEYNGKFEYHFLRSYLLRNKECHSSPLVNIVDLMNNLQSTLITELWFIHFFKDKLNLGIRRSHGEKMHFNEYIQNSFDLLKQQATKFVHLSLRPFGKDKSSYDELDINEIFNKDTIRVRVLGEGGSGKTTTLEYLVYRYCLEWSKDNSKKIPVLIYLANVKENESIKESISNKLSTDLTTVDELIESNSIIIFLDGVNEIVKSKEEKKIKLKEIASIINNNEQLDIVITDRYELDTTQNDPFNISTYSIQKLNENQIERFVINYSLNSGHSPENILKVIQSKPNLKELLLKPLLLSRAIEIIKIENTLPEKESLIIERFIDLMLEREKNEKMDPMLKISEFKLLMAYAANYIFLEFKSNSSINGFKFQKILMQGSEYLGFESFNVGYSLRMGFELEILSRKDDHYQFYHQSFFDFFVSYYLTFEES